MALNKFSSFEKVQLIVNVSFPKKFTNLLAAGTPQGAISNFAFLKFLRARIKGFYDVEYGASLQLCNAPSHDFVNPTP